jgi:hypothetical protein
MSDCSFTVRPLLQYLLLRLPNHKRMGQVLLLQQRGVREPRADHMYWSSGVHEQQCV